MISSEFPFYRRNIILLDVFNGFHTEDKPISTYDLLQAPIIRRLINIKIIKPRIINKTPVISLQLNISIRIINYFV